MNINDYDRVVEVRRHDKKQWYEKCLDFNYEKTDFIWKIGEKNKRCFICQKDGETILMNSNEESEIIENIDLNNFIEIEVGEYIYRKYSVLK